VPHGFGYKGINAITTVPPMISTVKRPQLKNKISFPVVWLKKELEKKQ
jgi:hypothetical protein